MRAKGIAKGLHEVHNKGVNYEFEFFRVGDGSKGGDAIVARYGTNGQYEITIIDGGTQATGEAIVAHVPCRIWRNPLLSSI